MAEGELRGKAVAGVRIRRGALLVAALFCAALLLSMCFVSACSGHDCHVHGERACPICLALEGCRALLAAAGAAAAGRLFAVPAASHREAEPEPLPARAVTPVSQKVKLLD